MSNGGLHWRLAERHVGFRNHIHRCKHAGLYELQLISRSELCGVYILICISVLAWINISGRRQPANIEYEQLSWRTALIILSKYKRALIFERESSQREWCFECITCLSFSDLYEITTYDFNRQYYTKKYHLSVRPWHKNTTKKAQNKKETHDSHISNWTPWVKWSSETLKRGRDGSLEAKT